MNKYTTTNDTNAYRTLVSIDSTNNTVSNTEDTHCDNEDVRMETCDFCGCEFPAEDGSRVGDDETFCPDCVDRHTLRCVDCEGLYRDEDTRNVIGHGTVCDDCYATGEYCQCSDCGDYIRNDDSVYVDDGDCYVCHDCYNQSYGTCESCGQVFHVDHLTYSERRDASYCDDCHPSDDEENIVHDYHWGKDTGWYSPRFAPGESRNVITLGVELEMDDGEFDESMGDGDDAYHFEHDGSLSDNGVEMITQPGSLRWHREVFGWKARCDGFRDNGFLSHDATSSCGLHVHIGRGNDMTSLTAAKIDMFINRNEAFFRRIARRDSARWGRMDPGKESCLSTKEAKRKYNSNRYQAVNHRNNNTVEIRIAKGTLNPETILGTLEIYHELVLFLKDRSVADAADLSGEVVKEFASSIMKRRKEFPEAVALLKRLCRSYIQPYVQDDASQGQEQEREEA